MTTTPTATISTDIAELGGAPSERNAAAIVGWNDAITEAAAICANADKSAHPSDLADEIRALKSAAPVAPEPAAVQVLQDILHDGFLSDSNTARGHAALKVAPQPLAEVSAAQAVPIAYAIYGINGSGKHYLHDVQKFQDDWKIDDGGLGYYWSGNELLASPSPAAQVVPEGWQLVPINPTDEMIDNTAAFDIEGEDDQNNAYRLIYRAMLAAAPSQPTDTTRKA